MFRPLLILLCVLSCGCSVPHDCTGYVNPFIGTLHEGHCVPGATVPMGMVQPGPESVDSLYEGYFMDHVTGYRYADRYLAGFTQTHLNGVGCPSMSDILLMPWCGREIAGTERGAFRSEYDKTSEVASPGYYAVRLEDNRTQVELTATRRVACHRYRFDDPATARVLVDLQYGVAWDSTRLAGNVLEARQEFDDYGLSGYRRPREWAPRDQYYTIRFDHRIASVVELPAPDSAERAPRYVLSFEMDGDAELGVRIALSTTSVEAARRNLAGGGGRRRIVRCPPRTGPQRVERPAFARRDFGRPGAADQLLYGALPPLHAAQRHRRHGRPLPFRGGRGAYEPVGTLLLDPLAVGHLPGGAPALHDPDPFARAAVQRLDHGTLCSQGGRSLESARGTPLPAPVGPVGT